MSSIDSSWIKLPRAFRDWRWYKDSKMVHLYLYILLHAAISEKEIGEIVLKRGQMLTSFSNLCNNTGLSLQSVRTCMKKLEKTKQIKVLSCKHHTTITVVSFDTYQPVGIDENNPNWIKLYRKIEDWQWYKDCLMTHLFIHLLLNAAVWSRSENGVLVRGQTSVTRRSLHEATGISDRSIRTCLEKLQKSKEIQVYQKSTNRKHIITICKYDSYQSENNQPNIQVTYTQHTNNIQCETLQQAFVLTPKSDQPKLNVNNCDTILCEDNNTNTNIQVTYKQHTSNIRPTHSQHTDNTQVTTYKKVRNKEIKNTSSSPARVRENEILENLKESENSCDVPTATNAANFLELLVADTVWLSAIARRYSLPDLGQVKQKLEDFNLDTICRGKDFHPDLQDYKSHFCDWLNINLYSTKKNRKHHGIYKQENANGSKFVPQSSAEEIYTGPF